MTLSFASASAQIREIKKDVNLLRIYNERGVNAGMYVYLNSGAEFSGYNYEFIVVAEGDSARIYDACGVNSGYYVFLNAGCHVKNYTASAILVKEGNITRYYDFRGNYMQYTND